MAHEIEWEDPPEDRRGGRGRSRHDYPVDEWVERRCFGETLQSIGDDYGLTRERVRQLTVQAAPHEPWKAIKAEQRRLKAEAEELRRTTPRGPCTTCGEDVMPPRFSFCSARCLKIEECLRHHTDEEYWLKHREYIAQWHKDHGTGSATYSDKVLEGRLDEIASDQYGRWFVEGSNNMQYAIEAAKKGWPIFDRLHPDLQEQITTVIRDEEEAA